MFHQCTSLASVSVQKAATFVLTCQSGQALINPLSHRSFYMPNFWLKNKYNTMHTLSKARKKSRLIFSCNINLVSFNFCNGLGGPDGPSGPSGADDLSISSGPG